MASRRVRGLISVAARDRILPQGKYTPGGRVAKNEHCVLLADRIARSRNHQLRRPLRRLFYAVAQSRLRLPPIERAAATSEGVCGGVVIYAVPYRVE